MKIPYDGKLAIFTSFYSHLAYAPYTICLAHTLGALSRLGVQWDYLARPSDFHIERAINNTLTELIERDDFTDVLLIDSDQSWRPEDVTRLLVQPEEIIAGTYKMKNKWSDYVGTINTDKDGRPVGKMLPDGTALLSANRVAAGFLRIKISALRKWAEAYPDLVSEEPDGKKVQFFSRALWDGEMYCQDMAFSRRWLEIGGELWIDPNLKIGHWGMECHEGDFDAHLRGKTQILDSFETVRRMAREITMKAAA